MEPEPEPMGLGLVRTLSAEARLGRAAAEAVVRAERAEHVGGKTGVTPRVAVVY